MLKIGKKNSNLKRGSGTKKPIYKKWWLYPLLLLITFFFFAGIPMLINNAYEPNKGLRASDALSFYGVILSGIITVTALIITLHFSKKDTEKQLKFYMSQAKAPFFQIEYSPGLTLGGNCKWAKKYGLSEEGLLCPGESGKVEIILKNIGDGIALAPSYKTDMFTSTVIQESVINKNSRITLTYDLQKNLEDKFMKEALKAGTKYSTFFTYITLVYQNMLGIDLYQTLNIEIVLDHQGQTLTIVLNEMSPQKPLN